MGMSVGMPVSVSSGRSVSVSSGRSGVPVNGGTVAPLYVGEETWKPAAPHAATTSVGHRISCVYTYG